MENIFSHIAYLLTEHECVIIPGFGALVRSNVPAKNVVDEDVFSPPSISLGFNSELKHNDGVLADSVKREQKISYNDANKMVSDFSAKLDKTLKNKKEFVIPQVGRFALSEDKKINFSPAMDLSANAGQFGFKNFYMPLLSEIVVPSEKQVSEESKDKHIIMIPLSKRLLTAVSVAAIALFFMLLSTPIDNKDIPVQYAGMFSTYAPSMPEIISVDSPEIQVIEDVKEPDAVVQEETLQEVAPVREEVIPVVKPNVEEKKINNPSDGYLIIIASFSSRREADRMFPHFKKEFNTASIIEKSDRSRIYIRSFQDKTEAERFLNKFRLDNPKHKDAWLLSNKSRG